MERSSQYPTHELIMRKDPMDPTDPSFGGAGCAIGDKNPLWSLVVLDLRQVWYWHTDIGQEQASVANKKKSLHDEI